MEMRKDHGNVYHDVMIRLVRALDVIMMAIPFINTWYVFYADSFGPDSTRQESYLIVIVYVLLYICLGRIYEAFKMSYHELGEMIYSQTLSIFEVNCIIYILIWLIMKERPLLYPFIGITGIQVLIAAVWSIFAQSWYLKAFPTNKTIIIREAGESLSSLVETYHMARKFDVVADVYVNDCIHDLSMLEGIDTVFIVGVRSHERNKINKYCITHGIKVYLIPRIGDLILTGSRRVNMLHLLMFEVEKYNASLEYQFIKRLMDIVLSLIAIVIFSPFIIITAVCIKLEDHGPVFYKQVRLTKDAKEFKILKFRSMRTDAEKDGVARLSSGSSDSRVTRVGRVIRKYRIDEIPQLFNILTGDLTIVGPRAERPELAQEYEKELPEFALRLQVKAGLTGYAQVFGKYNTTPYDKLLMDMMYISSANIFEDLKIIFYTVKILFMPESTEGVDEGQVHAMDSKR